MKTQLKSTLASLGLAVLTVLTFTGCHSTGTGGGSNTHEMGGPRTPRMDNSFMPNRGTPGTTSSGSRSNTHDLMPGRI